ncbi:ATP-binding cassette [Balamuthia mandrillaris]
MEHNTFELETFDEKLRAQQKRKAMLQDGSRDLKAKGKGKGKGKGHESDEEEKLVVPGEEEEETVVDVVADGIEDQEDMKIMKQAHHEYEADQYLSGGNVTALVELDEYEREDEALILTMKNIHKTYLLGVEGVPALRGVSLSVRRGEFLVIFGTSGGGKTSLLNIMGTIDKPTKGNMRICNCRVSKSTTDAELSEIRRTKLGFVFQTFNLLSSLTAVENVMLPMILAGKYGRRERRERARELLSRVGMSGRLNHVPSQLSGGEQQRVTIARSIANDPQILLLDEPTGDLDTINTLIVMKLLTDLHSKDGMTLIMVTHELSLKNFADRVIWMRDGKIQSVEEVAEHKRRDAYAQLEKDFAELNLDKDTFQELSNNVSGAGCPPSTPSTASSSSSASDYAATFQPIPFVHTVIRKPSDYSTHRNIPWAPVTVNTSQSEGGSSQTTQPSFTDEEEDEEAEDEEKSRETNTLIDIPA